MKTNHTHTQNSDNPLTQDSKELQAIQNKIIRLEGRPDAMLDMDLAEIYGTETKYIKRAVKRNKERFPTDFMFQLTREEFDNMRCQIGTSQSLQHVTGTMTCCEDSKDLVCQPGIPKQSDSEITRSQTVTLQPLQNVTYMPYAFTREGANMLSSVLHTETAISRSIQIMRAFSAMEQKAQQPAFDPMKALNDPNIMRGLLLNYSEQVIELKETVAKQQPKVEAFDRIANTDGATCITTTAKTLQMRPKDLFQFMSFHKWIYRRLGGKGWVGYQDKIQQDLLTHKVTTVSTSDGREKTVEQVLVTPKGLTRLSTMAHTIN